ncbi:membrane protein PM19L, partial [Tanacetum coccineum]
LACKEINMGGHRGWRLRIVEAFIIILAFTELLYVMLVHAGLYNNRYGPGYHDSDYGVGVGGHHHVEEPDNHRLEFNAPLIFSNIFNFSYHFFLIISFTGIPSF